MEKKPTDKAEIKIDSFSEHLFWDVDKAGLDFDKHQKYIIKYVLMYGLYDDWKLLQKLYGIETIGRNAAEIRDLDKKTASFVAVLSKRNVKDFACYTSNLLNQKHWNF
ncbi:MAG: hypothetical protein P1P88_05280 [Bacteroidales bacterium]|nr:hypothetical protein [Bacteroidales bacterium]